MSHPFKSQYLFILITSFLFIISGSIHAQKNNSTHDANECIGYEKSTVEWLTKKIATFEAKRNSSEKKLLADFDQALLQDIQTRMDSGEFICDTMVTDIVASMIRNIAGAHPDLFSSPFKVLVSKSPFINAQSVGFQVIIVNEGLLRAVESREELLLVIAHELSHDYLNHREHTIQKLAKVHSDESTNKEIDKIIKNSSSKRDELIAYLTSLELQTKAFSREQELAADSMALDLIRPLTDHPGWAIQGMKHLLGIDENTLGTKWRELLNYTESPFQSYWDYSPPPIVTPDSVPPERALLFSTHPNIEERLIYLQKHVAMDTASAIEDFKLEETLQNSLKYSGILFLTKSQFYARALFEAYKIFSLDSNDMKTALAIGTLWQKLYELRAVHTFDHLIPRPPYPLRNDYDEFLLIINNMRLKDFVKSGYAFLQNHPNTDPAYIELKSKLQKEL